MSAPAPAPAPVAVVTGAASGIGAAVAAELTSRGHRVVGLDLRAAPGVALARRVDVTDADAVAAALREITAELGAPRVAVSCAGHYEMAPIAEITADAWQRMLAVHVGGLLNLLRGVLPAMTATGVGAVVAIASELAVGGGSDDAHYAAAKGAVLGLVRSVAAEVAPRGVRVNAVAPGPTDTPMLAADSPWRAAEYLATLPAGRLARPDEVARCVGWLVEEGTFCVGEVLGVNSGAVI